VDVADPPLRSHPDVRKDCGADSAALADPVIGGAADRDGGFALVLCARIYRIGLLIYGKRATLPEVLKWLKYAKAQGFRSSVTRPYA